jgi:hypothetical protein
LQSLAKSPMTRQRRLKLKLPKLRLMMPVKAKATIAQASQARNYLVKTDQIKTGALSPVFF